jgi:hypothetical protein
MKDAKGHGSDARDAATVNRQTAGHHQAGVLRVGRFKVQQFNQNLVGQPWETINRIGGKPIPADRATGRSAARTVAENVARGMRADNRNSGMRASRVTGIRP